MTPITELKQLRDELQARLDQAIQHAANAQSWLGSEYWPRKAAVTRARLATVEAEIIARQKQ